MLISHGTVKIKSGLKSNHFDFLFRNSVLVENESKLLSLSYENNQVYQTWIYRNIHTNYFSTQHWGPCLLIQRLYTTQSLIEPCN